MKTGEPVTVSFDIKKPERWMTAEQLRYMCRLLMLFRAIEAVEGRDNV